MSWGKPFCVALALSVLAAGAVRAQPCTQTNYYGGLFHQGCLNASDLNAMQAYILSRVQPAVGIVGGIPYYNTTTSLTSSGALTSGGLIVAGTPPLSLGLGTTTTVLHGNAAGLPSYGAVALGAGEVSGTLPVGKGGTGITSGTGGGIPYFSVATQIASSGTLGLGQVVLGGGIFAAPTVAANGQLPATTTNDSAAAGKIGEYISATTPNTTATVTITIASPGVVTWNAHGLVANTPVQLTTTGALPTGLAVATPYYVVGASITANTFQLATSIANALAGTAINTSGSQSGTQAAIANTPLTTATATNVAAVSLTAGDWGCRGNLGFAPAGTTVLTSIHGWISTTSAALPTAPNNGAEALLTQAFTNGQQQIMPIADGRFSLSAPTTVYLQGAAAFTTSTNAAYGFLGCRRSR